MYCTKCGKQIDYDSDLCLECKAEQAAKKAYTEVMQKGITPTAEQPVCEKAQGENPRMVGFGKALTSTILGFISLVYTYMAYLLSVAIMVDGEQRLVAISMLTMSALFIGLATPFMVMGIKSIKAAKSRKNEGYPTPIAPLVLGICGTALNGIALVLCSLLSLIALTLV